MPRKSADLKSIIYYAPTNISKTETSESTSLTYSPSRSYSRETSKALKYAPQRTINRVYVIRTNVDYAPAFSSVNDYDYEPLFYNSRKYITKFAPSVTLKSSTRYAPESRQSFNYQPVFSTTFKPQPVLVSNYDTLNSYFSFLVRLLKVLR